MPHHISHGTMAWTWVVTSNIPECPRTRSMFIFLLCKCDFDISDVGTDVTHLYKFDWNKLWMPQCYRELLAVWHTASGFIKCFQHVGFLWPSQSGFSVDCWEAGLLKEWACRIIDGVEIYEYIYTHIFFNLSDGQIGLWRVLFSCCFFFLLYFCMYKSSEVPQNSAISLSKPQGVCVFILLYTFRCL